MILVSQQLIARNNLSLPTLTLRSSARKKGNVDQVKNFELFLFLLFRLSPFSSPCGLRLPVFCHVVRILVFCLFMLTSSLGFSGSGCSVFVYDDCLAFCLSACRREDHSDPLQSQQPRDTPDVVSSISASSAFSSSSPFCSAYSASLSSSSLSSSSWFSSSRELCMSRCVQRSCGVILEPAAHHFFL